MVLIIRKGCLPRVEEVPESLREAARVALTMALREPRPAGFPLLFTADMQLIEPVIAFLHEHGVRRGHTDETVRTYAEILYDWFDTLEQSGIAWESVDGSDLVAYRNRMLAKASPSTGRAYSVRTINHRVRGVLRFYRWCVKNGWLASSSLSSEETDIGPVRGSYRFPRRSSDPRDSVFVLRQFANLPQPITLRQARELLAWLCSPYDLMARWQLYTGLRVSELLKLTLTDVPCLRSSADAERSTHTIKIVRKGRKPGQIIVPSTLVEETHSYVETERRAWLRRRHRKGRPVEVPQLFVNARGSAVKRNSYQHVMSRASKACGFRVATHVLRATFACTMLARLEQIAKRGVAINPLLVVKILLAHEHIDTTNIYLRAIAIDAHELSDVLSSLLGEPSQLA